MQTQYNVGDKVIIVKEGLHFYPIGTLCKVVERYDRDTYELFGKGDDETDVPGPYFQTVKVSDFNPAPVDRIPTTSEGWEGEHFSDLISF